MSSKASQLSAFIAVANTAALASVPAGASIATTANPTFTGTVSATDVTVSGNLTVSGTTTYINTTNLNIGDNIVSLNADLGASAPSENAGISVNRGTSANVAILWDESIDKWVATNDGTTYANIAIGAAGATLVANTTDTATYYFPMSNATTGSWTNAVVSTTVTYVPSTGTMKFGTTGANVTANSSMIRVSANATLHASLGANGIMINGSYGTNSNVLRSTGTGSIWTTINKYDVGLGNVQNVDQQSAASLTYGTVNTAVLATSGTANTLTYLKGNSTWAQPALSELANVAISSPTAGQALVYTGTTVTIGGTYTPGVTPGFSSVSWNKNSNTVACYTSNAEMLSLLTVGSQVALFWNGGANGVPTTIQSVTPGYSFDVAVVNPTGATFNLDYITVPTQNSVSYSWKNNSTLGNTTASGYLLATNGLYSQNTYSGTYSDGIVVDYTTGMGRISVGAADGLTIYNGGVASNAMVTIAANGNIGISNSAPVDKLSVNGTAFIGTSVTAPRYLVVPGSVVSPNGYDLPASALYSWYNNNNNHLSGIESGGMWHSSDTQFRWYYKSGTTSSERMRLDASSGQLYLSGGSSISTNGYTKLVNGVIIQWGQASVPANSTTTFNFPVTWPTGCASLQATHGAGGLWQTYTAYTAGPGGVQPISTTQFQISNVDDATITYYWFAVGY